MSGTVVTGTTTILGLGEQREYTNPVGQPLPTAQRVRVRPAPEGVMVALERTRQARAVDGGGDIVYAVAVLTLDRDEALNLARAIQRSLGINPDALSAALRAVEMAEDPDDLHEANEALYAAASSVIGEPAS